ncbi:MAG: carboxymuconolactone decarboxylase family protein [Chloroflexi bacterium]|nr:carboxymuconolactone decarboxylase family protein [Chloroflexota bacterium]
MPAIQSKKHYTFMEFYQALVSWYRSINALSRQYRSPRSSRILDPQFAERLMLAVTEVNGCAVCSYAHTKMALREGIPAEEVQAFISGDPRFIREEEAIAIAFAQHYADTKGRVDRQAYERVLNTYGPEKTKVIVAVIQMMMIANIIGMPLSALWYRIKGQSEPGSTLLYELGLPLSANLFLLPALFQALFDHLGHKEHPTLV